MKMLINGNWCGENNPQLEVRRSFDGRVIDTVPRADADDIENALTAATDAARVMAKLPAHARMAALNRAADKMDGEVEALAKIISDETSKPITEARGEAIRMSAMLRLSAYEGAHLRGETLSLDALPIPPAEDKMGFTLRVPRGVIVAITPFNYPALLVMHKIAPALATGNAVILKPTSATPLSALKICEIIAGSGFPEHALQCVTGGGNEIGDWLISDDRVHKISFTGSAAIGRPHRLPRRSQTALPRARLQLPLHRPARRRHETSRRPLRRRRLCQRRTSLPLFTARTRTARNLRRLPRRHRRRRRKNHHRRAARRRHQTLGDD